MATEKLIEHYQDAYASFAQFNLKEWVALISKQKDFGNPFDPSESEYHQLDPDCLFLADLDALLRNPRHPQAASCVSWWLCHLDWVCHSHLRTPTQWRRGMKKAFIYADLKAIGITETELLDVLKKQRWWSSADEDYLLKQRTKLWPKHSMMKRLKHKFQTMVSWFQRKKAERQLDVIVTRGKNGSFIPRKTLTKKPQ